MEENFNVEQNNTVNEPNIPNNKGSKKGLLIIITLLILVIAGLLVYIFVIKGDDKDKNSSSNANNNAETNTNDNNGNNNTNNNNTNVVVTDDDITNIVEFMHKYFLFNLTYDTTATTFDKTTLTTGQLEGFYSYISKLNNYAYLDSISKDEADNYFMKVYGFKPNNYKDIICLIDKEPFYTYDNSEQKWKSAEYEHGHGGYAGDFEDYYIVDQSASGNEISLDFIFMYYGEFTYDTYINGVDVYMGNEIDYDKYSGDEENHNELISEQKKYFKKHINEYTNGKLYNFVFTKEGSNYHLKSFKVK